MKNNTNVEPDRIIEVCGVKVSFFVDANEDTVSHLYDRSNLTAEDIEIIEGEIADLKPELLEDERCAMRESYCG
jgi:pyridoxine 5'-phosphate synthase PdxJ